MEVTDAKVRKCTNVTLLMDKKMRERRIEHNKYIIMLNENTPFNGDEEVKILLKKDFEKIGNMLKSLKSERQQQKKEIENLNYLIDRQKEIISSLEASQGKKSNNKGKSFFKRVILRCLK